MKRFQVEIVVRERQSIFGAAPQPIFTIATEGQTMSSIMQQVGEHLETLSAARKVEEADQKLQHEDRVKAAEEKMAELAELSERPPAEPNQPA